MNKLIRIITILFISILLIGCNRKPKTDEEYNSELESISFDFDINNVKEDVKLPTYTPNYNISILWEVDNISSSISVKDGVSTLVNKLDYDGDYLDILSKEITLKATISSKDKEYSKEYKVTLYEKDPDLDYSFGEIRNNNSENIVYVQTKGIISWINEINDNYYNMIIYKDNSYMFVNNCYYENNILLKVGDLVKVSGIINKYNNNNIIGFNESIKCSVEFIKEDNYSLNPKTIDYKDINKNNSFLTSLKFNGVIKASSNSNYAYYIEGVNNKELIVNISNYSFINNNINSDSYASSLLNESLGKEVSITGFVFQIVDGVIDIILIAIN